MVFADVVGSNLPLLVKFCKVQCRAQRQRDNRHLKELKHEKLDIPSLSKLLLLGSHISSAYLLRTVLFHTAPLTACRLVMGYLTGSVSVVSRILLAVATKHVAECGWVHGLAEGFFPCGSISH